MALRRLGLRFALALAATACGGFAEAGDAAARRILGFSPDGQYFAFEQYTMVYEDEASFSEYVVVDTLKDRFVAGTPIRILVRGDGGLDEKKARADAAARAAPLLAKLRIGEPGQRMEGKPSIPLDEIGIFQMRTEPFAKSLAFELPGRGEVKLVLTETALGTALCKGAGGTGTPGTVSVQGFKLTLTLSRTRVLHDDQKLPAGRRCAQEYGIAEVYVHPNQSEEIIFAVMIEYADAHDYHAGPNRRFMVVTYRLRLRT